ncbi:MAG: hypothetical protein ABI680_19405, partial [Chthoniobacteraceae bacterium]
STPPKDEVAAPLGRLLKTMKMVVLQLIEDKVNVISEINPAPLPGETDKAPANDSGKKGGKGDSGDKLVDRQSFSISFIGPEHSFHAFVNQIISDQTQFMIPKSIKVANEKLTGPPRDFGGGFPPPPPAFPPPPGSEPPPGAPADPNAPGAPGDPNAPGFPPVAEKAKTYVVGDEKLQVTMVIEVVDFTGPALAEKKGNKKKGAE